MHQHSGKFTIPDIRDFVPEKIKPWILLVFALIFQFSGGVYMASASEMKGSLSLLQEDIMMAGYASLVGLALNFNVMFRLKFYLPAKNSLIVCSLVIAACNLICMHTDNVPLLTAVSFVSGFFRMWGTFTCNTNIQLWITPKRDMTVWFCFIPLIVQGSLQMSGLLSIYTAWFGTWQLMHWLVIGLLLAVTLITFVIFRHYRSMPKLPLFGIDWMGMMLWATTLISLIFVFNYGEYFDWFHSLYIRVGVLIAFVSLGLNLWRASFIRHPFIGLRTWFFRPVWATFIAYLILDLLMSPSHSIEYIYFQEILGHDELNFISLNWSILAGVVVGMGCNYLLFAKRKWTYKNMTMLGFVFVLAYLVMMYFIVDANLPKERILLPLFMRGFGYTIIAAVFLTALTSSPFPVFVESLSVQAFMSACLGGVIGDAFVNRLFTVTLKKNLMLAGGNLDNLNHSIAHIPQAEVFQQLQLHSMLVSIKEIYGLLCIAGCLCLLLFLIWKSTLRPNTFHPKFSTIRHVIKHQLKLDRMFDNRQD
jgi:hypothetical protein